MRIWIPGGALAFWIVTLAPVGLAADFIRGDADRTQETELTDAIVILGYLFLGQAPLECLDAGDVDDNGIVNVTDPTYLLNFLFLGGPPPPEPFAVAGEDPTDDELPCVVCGGAQPRYDGALGGTDASPWVVAEYATLNGDQDGRNSAPSIVVESNGTRHVVYSSTRSQNRGGYSRFDPGSGWVSQRMMRPDDSPVGMIDGRLVVGADDQVYGLLEVATGLGVWRLEGGVDWVELAEVPNSHGGWLRSAELDAAGCLHAAVQQRGEGAAIGRWSEGEWNSSPVGDSASLVPTIALSPSGVPHLAYWTATAEDGWLLNWVGPTHRPQTVTAYGSHSIDERNPLILVTGEAGEDRAHLLVRRLGSETPRQLEYWFQGAEGSWEFVPIHKGGSLETRCKSGGPGECSFDVARPIALVANQEGDVRILYSVTTYIGSFKSIPKSAALHVAWFDGDALRDVVVATERVPTAADVVIDDAGDLHMAYYFEEDPTGPFSLVHYLRLTVR